MLNHLENRGLRKDCVDFLVEDGLHETGIEVEVVYCFNVYAVVLVGMNISVPVFPLGSLLQNSLFLRRVGLTQYCKLIVDALCVDLFELLDG